MCSSGRLLAVALLAGLLLCVSGSIAHANNGRAKIVLLGDSYIAGNGARKRDGSTDNFGPKGCYRSNSNWAKKYIDQLNMGSDHVTLINRACSGSVSNDLLYDNDMEDDGHWAVDPGVLGLTGTESDEVVYDSIQSNYHCDKRETEEEYYRFNIKQKTTDIIEFSCTRFIKAQLSFIDASADMVLLSVGGNDIKFSELIMSCFASVISSAEKCGSQVQSSIELSNNIQQGSYRLNMEMVFEKLREKLRSDAKIVLTNYPYLAKNDDYILNDTFSSASYEASKNVRELGRLGDEVQRSIIPANESGKASVYYFDDIKEHFITHEPDMTDFWHNNEQKWIHTFGSRLSKDWFHYNPTGHIEVANILNQNLLTQIGGLPQRTLQDYDVAILYNESSDANTYQKDDMAIKGINIGKIRDNILQKASTARFSLVGYNLWAGSDGRMGSKSTVLHDFTSNLTTFNTKIPKPSQPLGKTQHGELRNALDLALSLKWRPGVKKHIYIIGKTKYDDLGEDKTQFYKPIVDKALAIDPVAISTITASNEYGATKDELAKQLADQTSGFLLQPTNSSDFSTNWVAKQTNKESISTPYAWAGEGLNAKIDEQVTLDASGSYDQSGVTSYRWDLNMDDEYEITSNQPISTHVFTEAYEGLIELKVTNANNKTASATFKAIITRDGDDVDDEIDNCPDDWNQEQIDSDNDGVGDECDESPGVAGYQDPNIPPGQIEEPEEESQVLLPPIVDDEPSVINERDEQGGVASSTNGNKQKDSHALSSMLTPGSLSALTSLTADYNSQIASNSSETKSDLIFTDSSYKNQIQDAFSKNTSGSKPLLGILISAGSLVGLGAAAWVFSLRLAEEEEL